MRFHSLGSGGEGKGDNSNRKSKSNSHNNKGIIAIIKEGNDDDSTTIPSCQPGARRGRAGARAGLRRFQGCN